MLTELLILPFLSANVWLASGHSLCFDSLHSQVYVVNYISLPNWEGDMVRLVCRYLPKTNIGSCTTSPHWPTTQVHVLRYYVCTGTCAARMKTTLLENSKHCVHKLASIRSIVNVYNWFTGSDTKDESMQKVRKTIPFSRIATFS